MLSDITDNTVRTTRPTEAPAAPLSARRSSSQSAACTSQPVHRCPVQATLTVLHTRWAPLVLWHLLDQARTFGVLRRRIGSISERMLTRELQRLEALGVVSRTELTGRVRFVRYALTPAGRALRPSLIALWIWGRTRSGRVSGDALTLVRPMLPTTRRGVASPKDAPRVGAAAER